MKDSLPTWWGDFSIEENATAQWEIGPQRIHVQRLAREWLIAQKQIDPSENNSEQLFSYSDLDLSESDVPNISRFVIRKTPGTLTVLPALADRSIVSRPYTPFSVPVGEDATIYLSTPLWVRFAYGRPLRTLYEFPLHRPSDTWFGPSTIEGEICYASRTYGRLNLENLTGHQYRALTQVHIENNSNSPLLIERINVPVPFLSLFYAGDDLLWTETVTMVHNRETSLAEFQIQKEPPPSAVSPKRISKPRQEPQKSMLIRAFSALKLQGFDG
ncbi:MAG: hypothetical protein PVJ21_23850 [Anaerolineales bacterium]|jgi:hypothetical protein